MLGSGTDGSIYAFLLFFFFFFFFFFFGLNLGGEQSLCSLASNTIIVDLEWSEERHRL